MTWDDLSKMTNQELFDELEYRLDEGGCRFLNILRGRFMSVEMERDQLREARREVDLARDAYLQAAKQL